MIPGLNSNVTHVGVEYHVQTEDLGRKDPCVLTLVFQAGAVIAREKVNYREILGDKVPEAEIRSFMTQQHRRIIRKITAGLFQDAAGQLPPEAQGALRPPPLRPKPVVLPSADKSLDDLITQYLHNRRARKSG